MSALNSLWVEKYRPATVADYVFQTDEQKQQFERWIQQGIIPHILLTGPAGTGKTTAAKMLIRELEVDEFDVLEINASRENSVDSVRERISNFVGTMPFGRFKVVLLDEFDFMSVNAQAALRGIMEMYHDTARFILTANYAHKIIPALHSRCQHVIIDRLDLVEFTARAATIMVTENVEFELETLDTYVKATYPDLRKCINTLQMNSSSGRLAALASGQNSGTQDYLVQAVALIQQRQLRQARALLCQHVQADSVESVYRWMYDNLDLWGSTPEQQDEAILIIRRALVSVPVVADQEINLAACMTELAAIQENS